MAKLSSKGRKQIKKKNFAFPEGTGPDKSKDQFPIHDKAHAANALARGKQNLSPDDFAKLKKKVCAAFPDLPACSADRNARMNAGIRKAAGRG